MKSKDKTSYATPSLAAISLALLTAVSQVGCTKVEGPLPGIRQKQATIKQSYCDNTLLVTIKAIDAKLLSCTKVSVTFEDAAADVLSDLDIKSAKLELKPNINGQTISFDIPLTNQFRPGIWHISELDFYQPKSKTWFKYKEGQDFAGMAIKLVNLAELPPQAKELEIENIEIKP